MHKPRFPQLAAALAALAGVTLQAPAPARADDRCVTEAERATIDLNAAVFALGRYAGLCVGNYPDLMGTAIENGRRLAAAYDAELTQLDRQSLAVFELRFPGSGSRVRDGYEAALSEPGTPEVRAYTHAQCESFLAGIEGMAVLRDWRVFTALMTASQATEGARLLPTCG